MTFSEFENHTSFVAAAVALLGYLWVKFSIPERFRTRNLASKQKRLTEIEAPDFVEEQIFKRNSSGLGGLLFMSLALVWEVLAFMTWYPKRLSSVAIVPAVRFPVLMELLCAILACYFFTTAMDSHS